MNRFVNELVILLVVTDSFLLEYRTIGKLWPIVGEIAPASLSQWAERKANKIYQKHVSGGHMTESERELIADVERIVMIGAV